MDKQTPEQQQQAVAAMANRAMGQEPPAAQPGAQPASPPKDSAMDKAADKGSPNTEGDKQNQEPVMYKIGERELSDKQINDTFDRYAKLNQMQDFMRPVLNLAAGVMQRNPGMTPDQLVKQFVHMANTPNPQMGGQDARPNQQGAPQQNAEEISKQFEQWEKDNAASLPPGYKEMMQGNSQTQAQMNQMMQMMQQVLGRTQGMVDASRMAAGDARNQSIDATKQRISNNLNSVQAKLGLGDDQAENFKMFAAERGFTMEDFIDPMLTMRVANDFKNALQSGEFLRLQDMASRRQAFTGTANSQPGTGQGAGDPNVDPNLEAMINRKIG